MNQQQLLAWLTELIADKNKSGRQELLHYIWALAACYQNILKRDLSDLQQYQLVELPIGHDKVQVVGKTLTKALVDEIKKIDYRVPLCDKSPLEALCADVFKGCLTAEAQQDLFLKMLREVNQGIPKLASFKVNLLMVSYHIGRGDFVTEHSDTLTKAQSDFALKRRPFEALLPDYIRALLPVITVPNVHLLPYNKNAEVTIRPLPDKPFVLPCSYSVSLPISEGQRTKTYLYDGSRLSLQSYCVNSEFLQPLQKYLQGLGDDERAEYLKHGSISVAHVNKLVSIFADNRVGLQLTVDWLGDLANMGLGAVDALAELEAVPKEFLVYLKDIIAKRVTKLEALLATRTFGLARRQIEQQSLSVFDKVALIETSLWELLMLAASGLSLIQLKQTLGFIDNNWQPSLYVGAKEGTVADVQLQDELCLEQSSNQITMVKTLFSSGGSAADGVRRVLKLNQCRSLEAFDSSALDDVLEQPQQHDEEDEQLNKQSWEKVQVWLNLGDDLHQLLIASHYRQVATIMAERLQAYISTVKQAARDVEFEQVVMVIDYSRFGANLPSHILYPILLQLVVELKKNALIADVVLLRANHLYTGGCFDRYQSGEVLSSGQLSMPLNTQLLINANGSFSRADTGQNAWQLRHQYIPLLKRFYLLSDFMMQRRFNYYEALYRKPAVGDHKALALWFYDYRLTGTFSRLVEDINKGRFNNPLKSAFRKQIISFWTKLSDAKAVIEDFNPLHEDILNLQVNEFIEFLKLELTPIVKQFEQLSLNKVHDKRQKISLGTYRAEVLVIGQRLVELP